MVARKIFIAAMCFVGASLAAAPAAPQSPLPPAARMQVLLVQIDDAIARKDDAAALNLFAEVNKLDAALRPASTFMLEAKLAGLSKDYARARKTLEAYFKAVKPDHQDYQEAARLYATLEGMQKEADAARAAAQAETDGRTPVAAFEAAQTGKPASQRTFRDRTPDGNVGPVLAALPTGKFVMGSPATEPGRGDDEPTSREVAIDLQIAVMQHELTVGEYKRFAAATQRQNSPGCSLIDNAGQWRLQAGRSWSNPGFAQTDKHPVVCITWADAAAYAAWLSETLGQKYRLPSETEWEYAAKGFSTAAYAGESKPDGCPHANVADATLKSKLPTLSAQPCDDGYAFAAPVVSFSANPFGLHDMQGNAMEWTSDCLAQNQLCIARGSNWVGPAEFRPAARITLNATSSYSGLGFRLVRLQ